MSKNEEFKGVIKASYGDSTPYWPEPEGAQKNAPNILYVVFDDTGFSELGCYGSDIPTPNIDAIANDGLRYNNFHVNALCSPTRASLLTGCNSHTVGYGNISEFDLGFPNLSGRIDPKYGFISETLQNRGYATYAVGKWHVSNQLESGGPYDQWPLGRGFEKFYGFLNGATSQFMPEIIQDNTVIDPPGTLQEGYHLSADLVDRAISNIATTKTTDPDRPFFCYLAFGAMHSPHQAPKEYIDKFAGEFDEGYDLMREKLYERQKEMGIIPQDAELPDFDYMVKPWDSLSDWEKKVSVRYMETFAGFLNYTDEQLGRLFDYLKKTGQYDNTLIVLLADNGASAEGGTDGQVNELHYVLSTQWPDIPTPEEYEAIGTNESHSNYPLGWSRLGNAPLKYYKSFAHAGGTRVPFIMSYPNLIKDKGGVRSQYHYVTDIFPTVLDICGIEHPEVIKGVEQEPKHGISMSYTLDDANAPRRRKIQYYETVGNRGIWCDGWKLVTNHVDSPSFEEDTWELYNTDEDFSEAHDLAEKYPEKAKELLDLWWQEAEKYGVLPMLESLMKKRDGFSQVEVMRFKPQEKKKHIVLYPEASINATVLRLVNKSFQITAKAYYRKGDEGVLFSSGFNAGGYVLYVEDGKLQFHYNFLGTRGYDAFSDMDITEGEHEFTFDFVNTHPFEGVGRVLIDGKSSGKAVAIKERPLFVSGRGLGIGRYPHSSVCKKHRDKTYFKYTGTLDQVDIEMDRPVDDMDLMLELEKELRIE